MELQVRPFVAPGFGENGYVVWRKDDTAAVVIDPGNAASDILALLERESLDAVAVLLTHAHIDHLEGLAAVVTATGAPVYLHPADRFLYDHAAVQARQFGLHVGDLPPVDRELHHGQHLELGGIAFEVRHVPGHSPGHVLFHVADAGCAFVGDIVFQGSIGRTDLPGGDFAELIAGIREQVLTLPAETVLYTGHGPQTGVGHEAATNPFLIPHYGGGLA
jgi:hydroxyacylglutathione hydrolase